PEECALIEVARNAVAAEQLAQITQLTLGTEQRNHILRANLQVGLGGQVVSVAENRGYPRTVRQAQLAQTDGLLPARALQGIQHQFVLAGRRYRQRNPPIRLLVARYFELQAPRQRRQRGALQQQRYQDDEERDVEQQRRIGQTRHDREQREHDRHRTAQANPGDERLLAPAEAKRPQRQD